MRVSAIRHAGPATAGRPAVLAGVLAGMLAVVLGLVCSTPAAASAPGTITEFTAGLSPGSLPSAIAAGADGNLWFTDEGTSRAIGRITTGGTITELSAGLNAGSRPYGIALGPEGDMWFTDRGTTKAIGRITPSGAITEFSAGLNAGASPHEITLGPDGDMWFTDRGTTKAIGRITPSGAITEYSEGLDPGAEPIAIAPGPDGGLWFTDRGTTAAIGRISTAGAVSEYSTGLNKHSQPSGIAQGPDGDLWFTDFGTPEAIGRITPSGDIAEFSVGITAGSEPVGIAPGPDGNLWFTAIGTVPAIGLITTSGAITEFTDGLSPHSGPVTITPGPDGDLWFADQAEEVSPAIGRVGAGVAAPLVTAPVAEGAGQAGAPESCGATSWSTWAGLEPSAGLFGFDGYAWLLDGSAIATGQSYTPTTADIGHQLACAVTVTYPLLDVTTSAMSTSVSVLAPPLPKPTIAAVHESASRWRRGARLAQISAHAKAKLPVGTTFSFSLNEQAAITFTFTRSVLGRKVRGRCVAKTHENARRKACKRAVPGGMLSFTGHVAANRVAFQGRLPRGKDLAPGAYTLTMSASNSAGASTARPLTFTIVR